MRGASLMSASHNTETVTDVHHWTDRLFSFTVTRDPSFRFVAGQFTMIGLDVAGRKLMRAYSMASATYEDHLEFFSIKVPSGPLTSQLQHVKPGDTVLVGRKPTGTLVADNLRPGARLYLLGTGTGLAPFMSIIREPDIYERFEQIILVHGCRHVSELAYETYITSTLPQNEFIGDMVRGQLLYYPTVTREPFRHNGRITTLMRDGFDPSFNLPPLAPESDRVMLCGSPAFLADMTALLEAGGFNEGNSSIPGEYVIEKAFVEK
jgi:ferredoxin--NADP+ reductase